MIQGRGTIPDVKSYTLEHPAGREWREYHTVTLKWIGGIAIFGMLALLTIYYLWHGTMRIEAGTLGTHHPAFQRIRALRALADRRHLRHPGDHRPQHQLRPQPDLAVAGAVGVQRMVGMGEILA